jgi:hypothetical protein
MRVGCCCVWLAVGWMLVMSGNAAAQSNSEYQKLVKQALHEYQLGNFSEAKAFFAQAQALSPNARTLRGLGMSSYEMRNYVEAIDYFDAALHASERPLTPPMHAEVTQLLGQARAFISRVKLSVQPATAEVRVDTHPVRRDADGSILLDPGTHELLIEAAEYESTTRGIRADGNEMLSFSVSLRPLHATPEPVRQVATESAEAEAPVLPEPARTAAPAPTAREASSSAGPWLMIGASAAVAVTGGVLLGVALSDKSKVEHPYTNVEDGPYYADYVQADRRVFPLSVAGIAALSVGATGLAMGLIWKLNAGVEDESAPRIEATAGGVRVRGRF